MKGIQMRVKSSSKGGGDNHKSAKIGFGHSHEPQDQKSSDLHESFLTYCRINSWSPGVMRDPNRVKHI
jgi:hypothetical protein